MSLNELPDVTTMNQHDASEYRRELIHALYNPGCEFDMIGIKSEEDEKIYRAQLMKVNEYLSTFPDHV